MGKVRVSASNLAAIANAIREKNGGSATYTPAQMAPAIRALTSAPAFTAGDIPAYVKAEALAVANKVKQLQTANTITAIVWADAHHTAEQVTSWQAQTNVSTLHAAMGMACVASMVPIDFGAYCGDYTFGNGETTLTLFEGQVKEMNKYMDIPFGGIPALYCVGNHDTGEYYLRDNPNGALYGKAKIYELIGSRNDDGTTVMGSTDYGYCYRDIASKKCRIICLNTVEGETDEGYTGGTCSNAQLLWFAQTLYSVGANSDWYIFILSHYPLDYGSTSAAGNILYQYVNGGSVTISGTTISFASHNYARFVANYHGHTHCLKAAKLNRIVNNAGTEFEAWRLATPSGTYYRNNDYANSPVYGINFGETTTYPKTADSGKDTSFVVNVFDPDTETIHSICYGAGYDRVIGIAATVYRSITNNLTYVSNSNASGTVVDGDVYTATLTPMTGYDMQSVSVTMGGVDITSTAYNSSTGAISIASVTGDVIITAVAIAHPLYVNVVDTAQDANGNIAPYTDGKSLSSSGSPGDYSGYTLTGFIPLSDGKTSHTYRIAGTGITYASSDEYNRFAFYNASHALVGAVVASKRLDTGVYWPSTITEANTAATIVVTAPHGANVPTDAAYVRFGAKGTGANLIITIDEQIQ